MICQGFLLLAACFRPEKKWKAFVGTNLPDGEKPTGACRLKQEKGHAMKHSALPRIDSRITSVTNLALPATVAILLGYASFTPAVAGNDSRAPDVPLSLQVPEGNKVSFQAYAVGVQIYRATASTNSPTGFVWTFQGPEAVLFDADGNIVGIHYAFAGPTRPAWETESGSRVVGIRTVAPVTVSSSAIPWLILSADPTNTIGPGVLQHTTYIQRVNTTGGPAPAALPTVVGQEARVDYTAEYFFFRESKQPQD